MDTQLALIIVAATLAFRSIWIRWHKHSRPPGPRSLPVLGSVLQLPLTYQQKTFAEWGKYYGALIFAEMFHKPLIVINSLKVAQELLDKKGSIYSDRPRSRFLELVGWDLNFAFLNYGDEWRRQRKWFQAAFQTQHALESYYTIQRREVQRLLYGLIEEPAEYVSLIKQFTAALVIDIGYGHTITSIEDPYVEMSDKALLGVIEAGNLSSSLVDFFPILQYLPAWMPGISFKRSALRTREYVKEMLDVPFEELQANIASRGAKPSFVGSLLEEASRHGDPTPEDIVHIKNAGSVLYAAGTDTTMTTLLTFFLAMVTNPDVFRKAQEEIDRVIGDARLPDLHDRGTLPYLDCILKELFRWNPPLPLCLPHRLKKDDDYLGYSIPGDSLVLPNLWAMGRDPDVYNSPESFCPERFEGLDAQTADAIDPRKFTFGFGRRVCPGRQFAESSIWLAAANILATMDIGKARDSKGAEIAVEPAFISGAASHPKPFKCDIRARSQKAQNLIAQVVTAH
ncbi:uncharacterized protein FIBRA_06784 [Fibroporia radiculosa]|uniref:Cytochrome P450 n=1 Tax=Fibroporia radiculosa TaxID=599839 RepID=J4HZN1_9APHY|nr:uncharacterized protein FIBRA_06784 [Fibroporia radiculosa]CCM04602.1 predicted protein [Fibroporia radiculosa]